jgi:hypothetical protein
MFMPSVSVQTRSAARTPAAPRRRLDQRAIPDGADPQLLRQIAEARVAMGAVRSTPTEPS